MKTLPSSWPFPEPGAVSAVQQAQGNGPSPPVFPDGQLTIKKRKRTIRSGIRRPSGNGLAGFTAPF